MRVGINGMGRIGRLILRMSMGGFKIHSEDNKEKSLEVVHVNDLSDSKAVSHLIKYDSLHGTWEKEVSHDNETIKIDNFKINYTSEKNIDEIEWENSGCELVLDCTGKNLTKEKLKNYFSKGVKKVIASAPVNDPEILNIVLGVNENLYNHKKNNIITAASCTTNCLAPIVKVLHKNLGVLKGQITTIHDITNTNVVLDQNHNDLRRARSSLVSMHPTTTGSAKAIGLIFPELNGKLNGHAVRIPILNSSLTDCVFQVSKNTSEKEVNDLFDASSKSDLKGILGIEYKPLVSVDFLNDTRSSIIDAPSTMVTDNNLVKIFSWYDNEIGYSARMIALANYVINSQ